MEVQSECAEPPPAAATPPCDPQPPPPTAGKINKAAFKLFGKRRSGSGMAGFFSFRNKGASAANNNNANDNGSSANGSSSSSSVEIIRSKTHDGLVVTSGVANGGGGAAEADGVAARSQGAGQEVGTVRSLSKSLSFFSLLRRGSLRASGGGESGGGAGLGRRGRGLKGLFSSMRWRRKDKSVSDGETAAVAVLEGREARCDENHREEAKDITLTLEPPPPYQALEDHGSTPEAEAEGRSLPGTETCRAANVTATSPPPPHRVTVNELPPCELDSSVFPYTPTDSPLHSGAAPPPLLSETNKTSVSSYSPPPSATPPLDAAGDPPSEPSVDRLCSLLFTDVTSLKSFDSLTGCGDIIADAEEEGAGGGGNGGGGGSGTSSSSSGGGGVGSTGGAGERPTGAAASRGSPCKPPLTSQNYTAAAAQLSSAAAASLPARARVVAPPPTPLPQQQHHPQTGSGVVAYMGGGEEMASPEGVDDADMQGLWHMLPSTGDNSPALPPRSHQTPTSSSSNPPVSHHHHRAAAPALRGSERNKPPQVKALGLSKIPVVGGGGGGGGGRAAVKPPLPHGAQQQHGHHAAASTSPPGDKEPLSDEGYWDTPTATPTATPDEGGGVQPRSQKIALMSRDSCSGDHLYDLYNDPEEGGDEALDGGEEVEEDDLACSTPSPSTEYKLSPPSVTTPPSSASSNSSFRSLKGSASLPRDSKIPISVSNKPTPPHSVSQSALSSVVEASVDAPPPKTTEASAPARTRIPVSKVPVRRSAGNASRGHRK